MDIIDGFLDSHYTYTNDYSRHNYAERRIQQQVTTISREISHNHLNVIYFTSKQSLWHAMSLGFAKWMSYAEESFVLIV